MNETERLSHALRAAVADIRPDPGLAGAVVRGAKRRRRTRWTAATAGTVLVAVFAIGAATSLAGKPVGEVANTVPAEVWMQGPTRGSLGGDRAFLDRALAAWATGIQVSPNKDHLIGLTGQAHVYWAGTTPAGPTAIVAEDAVAGGERWPVLGLLVGETPRLVTDLPTVSLERRDAPVAFQFGDGDLVTLVPNPLDEPRYLSPAFDRAEPGGRAWLPMAGLDGVALTTLPAGSDPADVRVAATPDPDIRDAYFTYPSAHYTGGFAQQSQGGPVEFGPLSRETIERSDEALLVPGNTSGSLWALESASHREVFKEWIDPLARATYFGYETVVDLGDGRTAHAFPFWQKPDHLQLLVVERKEGEPDRVFEGSVVQAEPFLATAPLPGGRTLVTSLFGEVSHTTGGTWIAATGSAAVLPADATAFRVAGTGFPGGDIPL
ncbi:hypothetical protein [Actinokineospora pegani]|uniref:hypothetical protein n=1 Tax=Actinokineospora pegani TaxID=2654637 RepID=UPI0012EA0C24|nr:hypothetical protein [Actinokineospora pegani]